MRRNKIYGKQVYIRGLIEFTNYCKNDCFYCGIRRSNSNAQRYRLSADEILECAKNGYELGFRTFVLQGGEDAYYSDEVLCGIEEHSAELDEKIAELAIGWSVERMPKVDLSILRVALYEMMYMDKIPSSVSINEAVELAKRFGGDRSSAYINGMLGTFARQIDKE